MRKKVTLAKTFSLPKQPVELPKILTIGNQVAYYRKVKELRQEDLADAIGVGRKMIMHIEKSGDEYYNIATLARLFEHLEMTDKVVLADYHYFLFRSPPVEIKQIRTDKQLSQQAFANLLGVSRETVKRWESGKVGISKKCYERLMKVK